MQQEVKTLTDLIRNPETLEMGFDMAKQYINVPEVQTLLCSVIDKIRDYAEQFKGRTIQLTEQQRTVMVNLFRLLPRIENYLQVMQIIDDNGNRIEDFGGAFTPGPYSGTGSGNSVQPGIHSSFSGGYTRTNSR